MGSVTRGGGRGQEMTARGFQLCQGCGGDGATRCPSAPMARLWLQEMSPLIPPFIPGAAHAQTAFCGTRGAAPSCPCPGFPVV